MPKITAKITSDLTTMIQVASTNWVSASGSIRRLAELLDLDADRAAVEQGVGVAVGDALGRKQTPSVTRSLICDRGLDAGAVLGDPDLVAGLQAEALGVGDGELDALLRGQEPQRRVQLGDRAGPEVAVGAEREGRPGAGSLATARRTRCRAECPRERPASPGRLAPGSGAFARSWGVLPADAAAADVGVGDAGVEGDRSVEGCEGCGLGVDAGVVAEG